MEEIEVRVLGAIEVRRDGTAVPIGGPKPRRLLAVLLAHANSVVSSDRLCEELWGEEQPASAIDTLQSTISRLRRVVGDGAQIVARPPGYVFEPGTVWIDSRSFEALLTESRSIADASARAQRVEEALSLWRGPAFGEFAHHDWARSEAVRLDELKLVATEELIDAHLADGSHGELVGELEGLVTEHPLRERFWLQLAVALYRSGRHAESLRRLDAFRSLLRDQLGLDVSAAAREMESRILAQDDTLFGPSARSATASRNKLVSTEDATRLLGRERDLEAIEALTLQSRLITLVGPGGVGKTRLALRAAAVTATQFTDGSFVVHLAAVRDPDATIAAVAATLDVQQRQHLSMEDTIVEFLRERRMMVVLDNCEHLLVRVAPFVDRVRSVCAQVVILATSREPLGLAGEHVWPVEPLEVSPREADIDVIAAAPAVQLFVERAAAARSGFELTEKNAATVAEICRRLDGLPLALELAAARLRALGPEALVARLDQRFQILGSTHGGGDSRHRSLHDLVQWSLELLTADEQRLFYRLAVFAGGFDLDAVEQVCGLDDLAHDGVASLLANLVDKSMVQLIEPDGPRYQLLETMRELGADRLDDEERSAVQRSHAQWYLSVAERAALGLTGPDEARWMITLEHETDNLRAAHNSAVRDRDIDTALRLVAALREFSFRRINYEITAWASTSFAMPDAETHPRYPTVAAVVAYGQFVRGDLESALEIGQHAVAAGERLGTGTSGLAERTLGNAIFYKGDAATALRWMDRQTTSARTGSKARLAHALYMQSVAHTSVGDTVRGAVLAGEASAAAQTCRSPTALAQAAYALGVAMEPADPEEAEQHLRRAVTEAARAGNRWIESFALTEIYWLHARAGDTRNALLGYSSVIETWYRGGDWANQWLSLRHVFGLFVELEVHRVAATLHGALSAAGAAYALPFLPADAERLNQLVDELRRTLGPAGFAAAVRHGASMRDAEIIGFVLHEIGKLQE
ncbi:MAG: BTAD domain-containing putative transcriptional regulator [Acidimicrobiales bacterium]